MDGATLAGGLSLGPRAAISPAGSRSRVRRLSEYGDSDGYPGSAYAAALTLAKRYVERFIGSARRECLDHFMVFNAAGLQRLMKLYCAYYDQSRTHLSLNKDAPIPRPIAAPVDGRVVAIPQVGGLHHRYERLAG
jgi:hypothetical protein